MVIFFLETGKFAGGLIAALVLALAVNAASNRIFTPGRLAEPAYLLATAEDGRSAQAPASNAASAAVADKPGLDGGSAVASESIGAEAGLTKQADLASTSSASNPASAGVAMDKADSRSVAADVSEARSVRADAAPANGAPSAEPGASAATAAALSDSTPAGAEKKTEAEAMTCQGCDASEQDSVAMAGPPLFAIVDGPKSTVAALAHFTSLKPEGVDWMAEDLDQFIAGPHGFASATLAAVETDGAKPAEVVEYLRAWSDHPRRSRGK